MSKRNPMPRGAKCKITEEDLLDIREMHNDVLDLVDEIRDMLDKIQSKLQGDENIT